MNNHYQQQNYQQQPPQIYKQTKTQHQQQPPTQQSAQKKKMPLKKKIIIGVAVFLFLAIVASSGSTDTDVTTSADESTSETQTSETVATTEEPTTSQEDFKESCAKISYETLARNPDNYKNQNLVFTGEVVQCEKTFGTSYYARVNVTLNEYGFYEDTIYVTFKIPEGADKILEEDIITIYGVCEGEKSYRSIFGEQITIPSLEAVYIELIK